jgi:adenine/guanine phosphoribosyltransferase-like PRPP-binding protein
MLALGEFIIQSNKISHSHKDSWYRFAYRLEFSGSVEPGKKYIFIDDIFSNGGSFSELHQHIESHGGKAVLAAVLITGGHGERLALSPQTAIELTHTYYRTMETPARLSRSDNKYSGPVGHGLRNN